MIACFDTNIYVGELRGSIPLEQVQAWRRQYLVRLSPVVYHELLRGARNPTLIMVIRDCTITLPVPTWTMWAHAAEVLKRYVQRYGVTELGLARLQNDLLIAVTIQAHGGVVITTDRHFERLAAFTPFHYLLFRDA